MGFGTTNWPRHRRIFTVCEMPPVRGLGRKLFPEPETPCEDLCPLPPELDSIPGHIQDSVTKGMQIALRDLPPLTVSRSPNEYPPFRSSTIDELFILVTGSDAIPTVVADMNAAITAHVPQIQGARFPVTSPLTPAATPNALVPFLLFESLDYERLHFSGIDIIPTSLDAFLYTAFTILVNGGETAIDRASISALRKLSIDVPPKSRISLLVQNRDIFSAFTFYVTVRGWTYECEGQGNFLSQSVLRQDGQWEEPNGPCVPPRRRRRLKNLLEQSCR